MKERYRIDLPQFGWKCVKYIDTDDICETCQMCGTEEIRYLHYMAHPDVPDIIEVGRLCAARLSGDLKGAEDREKILKNIANRKKRWLTRKWNISQKGNHFLRMQGNHLLVFETKNSDFSYAINGNFSSKFYKTMDEAKMDLFEACFGNKQ